MTDKLKQYIDENRAAFDSEEPSPHLFRNLKLRERRYSLKKVFTLRTVRWAAVFIGLILLSAAYYFVSKKDNTVKKELVEQPVNIEKVTGVTDPIYAKQIYHFQELIGLKQEELKQLQKDYPDLYNQFVGDLDELDSSYQALKTNFLKNPNREMVLEAMIQNLQIQSDLLNRQLLIIKEIKQKSKSHEKNFSYHNPDSYRDGIMPV